MSFITQLSQEVTTSMKLMVRMPDPISHLVKIRTIKLNFTESGGAYTALLSFATVEVDSDPED